MALTADEIIKVLEKAKELGAKTIEVEGIKTEFTDSIIPKQKVLEDLSKDPASAYAELQATDDISAEELLYWATPYYDYLQEQKELKKQRIEEEAKERDNG